MPQTDRTVAALKRLAKGLDGGELEALLSPGRVAVCLGPTIAREAQAQLLFSMAVNLSARLYPVIQDLQVILPSSTPLLIRPPRWGSSTLAEHLRTFLQALDPPLHWTVSDSPTKPIDCILVLGDDSGPAKEVVFVGSHGWLAAVSPIAPVPIGPEPNPVGAYAAACLGVAEVWKRLLEPHRDRFPGPPILPLEEALAFSTFTYRTDPGQPNPCLSAGIDVNCLTLVGLGAGGSALAFTLASLKDLCGVLNLVEPDEVVDSNLNRYVSADSSDAADRRFKAHVNASLFAFPGLSVNPHPKPYGEVVASLSVDDHRYVVATVHSREARRELQHETPMVLWDAGATEQAEFFIWRIILGTTECMWCKHPPGEMDPEWAKAAQLAELLGLDPETWRRKIRDNQAFDGEEIAMIGQHVTGKDLAFELPIVGQHVGDWEASQCGRLALPELNEEIPIPFAPVMAGILLAGEIIKEHYFPEAVLDSYYWNTLLGRFMRSNRPHRRFPRPDCSFCHDRAYLTQYQQRWGRNLQRGDRKVGLLK